MRTCCTSLLIALVSSFNFASLEAAELEPPKAGPVEIMKSSELRPGMKGTAWTVFEGAEPEPIPVDIIGLWKNAWGPRQDVIIAKLGGKAQRTNVAGGMSGSPVYIDGKLIGAIALRISAFSPDAICGITPIELMTEVKDFDFSLPGDAITPDKMRAGQSLQVPERTAGAGGRGGRVAEPPRRAPTWCPSKRP